MKWSVLLAVLLMSEAYAAAPPDNNPTKAASTASESNLPFIADTSSAPGQFALDVAGKKINATYLEETLGDRHGAVLILPDQDGDIDSRGIVHKLRHGLLAAGWSTMTVAMHFPFKANIYQWPKQGEKTKPASDEVKKPAASQKTDAKPASKPSTASPNKQAAEKNALPGEEPDNQQRIAAALDYLKSKGIKNVIMLGHGKGGVAAAQAVMQNAGAVKALILVATPRLQQSLQTAQANIAVADFYGDLDRNNVLNAVKARKAFMHKQPKSLYVSRKLWGADHDFYGMEDQLLSAVRGWLRKHFVKDTAP